MSKIKNILSSVWHFYIDSFKNTGKHGKRLFLIILIKFIIFFGILKVFFFKEHIPKNLTEQQKSELVINEITKN